MLNGSLLLALAASSPCLAIPPFKRAKPGRLRLSLAAYSMRQYLQPKPDEPHKMDLFDFVDYCREQGLNGAELTSYYFPEDVDTDYLLRLKQHCHVTGITITGGAIRNDFCTNDPEKLEASLAHTRLWVDRYAILGAPAIRVFAGNQPKDEELSVTLERCAKTCQKACDYAASKGVFLALENHGGVTAHAKDLLEIVRQVESPALGINFDSGNFRSAADPYSELVKIAPYAVNAQIKVEMHIDGKTVPADLSRIVQILQDSGYSGWVALEYEAKENPMEAIPKWLGELRQRLS